MDPMTWKDPKQFDPERFLDKDGNIIGSEMLLPFGLGMSLDIVGLSTNFPHLMTKPTRHFQIYIQSW